ncbi:hypothetical protein F511_43793 [Dorcoceras hygrometricum]|uniref:Uncharacterized protein n=1 Tax=Dorcoceras hygrometricum TaxID=472368 RepID=A0A2Z7BTW2_9LAMI|nr:hypothetical protein F511_43793 [Dorcoceras hygrometricum]
MKKPEKAAAEKKKKKNKKKKNKKKEKVISIVVQKPVEARSQAAPATSMSGTSSDVDSCLLAKIKKGLEAQQSMTFAGKCIFDPMEIREINWAMHFLPKIDPTAKGKEIMDAFSWPTQWRTTMVVYTGDRDNNQANNKADSTQDGLQRSIISQLQVDVDTAKEITSLKDIVSTLGLNVERIKNDAFMAKHTNLQFKRQIDGLETSLVRHFADRQQQLEFEIAFVKSQLAEMVDCVKELRDAKKGEGTSSKNRRLL